MKALLEKLTDIEELIKLQSLNCKKVLSVREAAIYMDISEDHLYRLTSMRAVPHSKPNGKKLYFEKEEIDNWLLSNKVKTLKEIEEEADIFIFKK